MYLRCTATQPKPHSHKATRTPTHTNALSATTTTTRQHGGRRQGKQNVQGHQERTHRGDIALEERYVEQDDEGVACFERKAAQSTRQGHTAQAHGGGGGERRKGGRHAPFQNQRVDGLGLIVVVLKPRQGFCHLPVTANSTATHTHEATCVHTTYRQADAHEVVDAHHYHCVEDDREQRTVPGGRVCLSPTHTRQLRSPCGRHTHSAKQNAALRTIGSCRTLRLVPRSVTTTRCTTDCWCLSRSPVGWAPTMAR